MSVRFAERSLFEGIARNRVGRTDLVAHSVGVLSPALSALGTGLLLPTIVGPGFWISAMAGFGLAFVLAGVFDQFSSRFKAAGSLYTYVAKGLGASAALVVGVAMVVGYGVLVGFGLTGATGRFERAWLAFGGGPVDSFTVTLVLLAAAAACVAALRKGIAWATRTVLIIEILSIALLVAVFASWLARFGIPGFEVFSLEGASLGRVLAGAAVIATLTVAFECSASLALESQRALSAVPSSMRVSLAVTGVFFFAATVVGTVRPEGGGLWSGRWFGIGEAVSPLDGIALVLLGFSLLALALSAWSALARLLFTFAREGLLWRSLGETTDGVPMRATWAAGAIALVVPTASWAFGGRVTAVSWPLLVAATLIMCVVYAGVALALLPFLRSIDEVRPGPVILSVVGGLGAIGVVVDRLAREHDHAWMLTLLLLAAVLVFALTWRWVLRRLAPAQFATVGRHDATLSSEVAAISPSKPWDDHGRA